ncbi:hypothetical protein BV22DRAFT_1010702 [Leucogyrophana mollusca]|uniref:Uncharacterized protein n=1 Tax=Leucogyrophana mollusca TaxID=85980 RepID=A0ACB8BLF2_9AGAM|nr:hypothetical protein BV22DRAFT_1010702 [Leucogyrophana mollusca]
MLIKTDAQPEPIGEQVEGVLFRVPRHPFVDGSDVFRQLLQPSVPDGIEADGCSNERPLRLEHIQENDFKQLLKVLFPEPKNMPNTFAEWRSVLKLSAMWKFESTKKLAVDHMSPMMMDPVDKICLANDYDVQQWLVPALDALATRKEPIGMKDAERLGMELTLKVAAIRERGTFSVTRACRFFVFALLFIFVLGSLVGDR